MRKSFLAALLGTPLIMFAAQAETPPKFTLVRGVIQSYDGKTITIKPATGDVVTAAVTDKMLVGAVEARTFSQLKPTDFIGVTAVPGKGDHLRAEEVHILPVVGMGEGQYPWDHHPDSAAPATSMGSMTNGSIQSMKKKPRPLSSMTNGTVTSAGGAMELNVSYHGAAMVDGKCAGLADPSKPGCTGMAIVDVSAKTPIVAIVGAKKEDIKPGLAVFARIGDDPAGHPVVASVTLEKNGVKPPM